MITFKQFCNESMSASAGGVFGNNSGSHGGAVGNSDWYAMGDARIPKVIGIGAKAKKKKGKKNAIPVMKRSIYMGM
jgi:hypothetical protein